MVRAPGPRCPLPGLQPRVLPCPRHLRRVLFPARPRCPDHLSVGTTGPSGTDWGGGPCTLRSCQPQAWPSREGHSMNAKTSRAQGNSGTLGRRQRAGRTREPCVLQTQGAFLHSLLQSFINIF